jgi:hypothetical protein
VASLTRTISMSRSVHGIEGQRYTGVNAQGTSREQNIPPPRLGCTVSDRDSSAFIAQMCTR